MADSVIDLENISVLFEQEGQTIKAVNDVTIHVNKGDIYGVVGYSGAGKSTLVRVINLLQKPTSGKVVVNGETLFEKNGQQSATEIDTKQLRAKRRGIGMIFQHFNLLEERTVSQNIEFALKHSGQKEKAIQARAQKLLELVGLGDRGKAFPAQLSGGQQQRVAIARALANDPEILISDEATSALDPKNTIQILDLLKRVNQELGLTVVLITHEMDAVKRIANKVAVMSDGQIVERGSIVDVFTNPKYPLTKELIGTAGESEKARRILATHPVQAAADQWELLHLTYTGPSVIDPVVTELYQKFDVEVSIIFGNVDELQGIPVGTLFVTMTGAPEKRQQAISYLHEEKIGVSKIEKEAAE
ncbi:methionine ABC transporter ATP-binding protein [Lentilactobacillus farraginis]|uniref:ABC transporter, ATP-binding protein n=1 Tax=Lentilactobacillus farraginis DSM 18382 = JCM 14108 TaxID=1423743 RepID=X0QDU8_9LACO|nr:ATP-binding cassette domain-containing protein [Lentilactobacillus farraginis]KRM08740.1 ABC transporter, ATP-binding protein [Lentilactobacillus farraginis DSM 18382 = JCM 14108]GAF36795.1 methionine ABC transporter ATP-binding protein [Lentilactobacillus farraginis DSM 18382 = JCM 14108]